MLSMSIQEKLAKLEQEIQHEIDESDGYWPQHLYTMIAEANLLARKLR